MQNNTILALSISAVVLLAILLLLALVRYCCAIIDNQQLKRERKQIIEANKAIADGYKLLRDKNQKLVQTVKEHLLSERRACVELSETMKKQIDDKLQEFVPLIIKKSVGILRSSIPSDIEINSATIQEGIDGYIQAMKEGFMGCIDGMKMLQEGSIDSFGEYVEVINNQKETSTSSSVSDLTAEGIGTLSGRTT